MTMHQKEAFYSNQRRRDAAAVDDGQRWTAFEPDE